jgi:hypothetical protein
VLSVVAAEQEDEPVDVGTATMPGLSRVTGSSGAEVS